MTYTIAILFVVLILWWLITKELPLVFGALVPTSAIRRKWLFVIFVGVMAATMLLPMTGHLGMQIADGYSVGNREGVLFVGLSVFVTMLLLEHLGMMPSLCVTVLGALEAHRVFSVSGATYDVTLVLGWIISPMLAMLLAAILFFVYRKTLGRSKIHIIRLSAVMRYVVILGIAFSAFAIGWNNGSLLIASCGVSGAGWWFTMLVPVVMFVATMMLFAGSVGRLTDLGAERYADMSTQMVVSLIYAVAITLLLFSTDVVRVVGLSPMPLGVPALLCGALVGVSLVGGNTDEIVAQWRPLVGVVLAPLTATLCYWLLSTIVSGGAPASVELNFSILVCVLMLVLVVVFGRYVRKQERLHRASRRLIVSQQQELYENQKALNALEMKTILAENNSLHSTLELKRKEIINVALGISEQKEFLEMLAEKAHRAAKASGEEKDRLIAEIEKDLSQRTSFSGEIDEFYTQAEVLHKDFSVKLTEEFPNLTTSERRLATLLRLGFSSKYIATLMNISPKSVEISRYRLRQKLGLQKGDNLINFIKSI